VDSARGQEHDYYGLIGSGFLFFLFKSICETAASTVEVVEYLVQNQKEKYFMGE
jgi:hypothetical protein